MRSPSPSPEPLSASPGGGGSETGNVSRETTGHQPVEGDRLPSADWLLGLFLFACALVIYLATMCWAPAPGTPTQMLLLHLRLEPVPAALDPIWGWVIRCVDRLPGLSVAAWAGLVSAFCGASAVGGLGLIMCRVGFVPVYQTAPASLAREKQARQLSGLVSGLYLAGSVPFWLVATRSLPGSFHLLLLVLTTWSFSNFQRSGRIRHLSLLGLLYGLGMAEFATFLVFVPVALFLGLREMIRWGAWRSWKAWLVLGSGLLAGLALYPVHAREFFRYSAANAQFASAWQALAHILREQAQLITQAPYRNPIFVFIMVFALAIWLLLFVMSHRSPWFYEGDQIAVRLVFAGVLLFILLAVGLTWKIIGLSNLMLTPLLLMSASMGYLAGELWILGEIQILRDDSGAKRLLRRSCSTSAVLLPVVALVGGILNWRVVDGRHARIMEAAVEDVLAGLQGRDIVFSTGMLDDSLRLASWERRQPLRVITVNRLKSAPYLQHIAHWFEAETLREPLKQAKFSQFLDNLLLSDEGPARTAVIDMAEIFRDFGILAPDRFIYRLEPSTNRLALTALVESQRPFWNRMGRLAADPVPENNLICPYQDYLLLLASKVANNLALLQAKDGDETGALDTLRNAHRLYPDNLSVLLNLLELGRELQGPEPAQWQADWQARQLQPGVDRWALANRYGFVWNALSWARRGWIWVLSGDPIGVDAVRRSTTVPDPGLELQARLLEQIELHWGIPFPDESHHRAQLMKDDKNGPALLALARLALRRNAPETAEAYLQAAMNLGLSTEDAQLNQCMIAYVRGDRTAAVEGLRELVRIAPQDMRAWMALLLLTDERDPVNPTALSMLKSRSAPVLGQRLALAWFHLQHRQWPEAQAELDQALQLDARNAQAWELLATLAQIRGNHKLRMSCLRTLFNLNPNHPMKQVAEAIQLYQRGEVAAAEAVLHESLRGERHPDVLNALANLLMEAAGDSNLHEGLTLANEAVRLQPFHPLFRGTRAEWNLRAGQLEEAAQDLRLAAQMYPNQVQVQLLTARIDAARGNRSQACQLARKLVARRGEMSREQGSQLDQLLQSCDGND